jgi:hypothetical protein
LFQKSFELTRPAAKHRRNTVWIGLLLIWIYLTWHANPEAWTLILQNFFVTTFRAGNVPTAIYALNALAIYSLKLIFAANVIRPILVLLAPFLLAWQFAAIYLQDIFELEDVRTARRFIAQLALAGQNERIHIRAGSIKPDEEQSSVIQIGGPGKVQVELDSAALFERSNGEPFVVGPSSRFIDGFDRLREVIDLRDMMTDSMTNISRSRDGIPVIAKDIRLIYSVLRANKKASLERPYPFQEKAIRDLVYQQTTTVKPGGPKKISNTDYWRQTYKRWSGSMPGLIRGSLNDFVSEHPLSEFLANIGEVELERLQRLEEEIRLASETMAPGDNPDAPGNAEEPNSPSFTARAAMTNLFYDFTSGFPKKAENRGVQLEWIGVGTWSTPASAKLINESHLEAWRISRENYLRGHPEALRQIQEAACLQELQNLIQEVPLATYREARDAEIPAPEIIRRLLLAYREAIKTAWDLFERDKKSSREAPDIPEKLTRTLRILNGLLAHYV